MSEHSPAASLAESISALADGQASELELARLLKAAETDPEVTALWHRYHVARTAMHKDLSAFASAGFAERVSAAVAAEDSPRRSSRPAQWLANAGRLAVAASVAGAVILGAQLYQSGDLDPGSASPGLAAGTQTGTAADATDTVAADHSLPAGFNAPPLAARPVSTQPLYDTAPRRVVFEPREAGVKVSEEQIRHYLNQLVESHTEHAAVNSSQGILPFARLPLVEED